MNQSKRLKLGALGVLLATILVGLTGCMMEEAEIIPIDNKLVRMEPLKGSTITFDHQVGGQTITTAYDLGEYRMEDWRITDSKSIHMEVTVKEGDPGVELLVEHVHADVAIKSTDPQLNGMTQDSMDNAYHGTSQDGFFINNTYSYSNIFAVEGFSKDIIDGWGFYCGDYGASGISSKRLTEKTLLEAGSYGSQLSVVYNFLVKNPGDTKYHVESVEDRIIIPTKAVIDKANATPTPAAE